MEDLIKRVKLSCGYTSEAALARAMGMSPQNFHSVKKTGNIKDSLILHAINKGVNQEWLITGKGNVFIDRSTNLGRRTDISLAGIASPYDILFRAIQEQIGVIQDAIKDMRAERMKNTNELNDEQNRCWDRINAMQGHVEKMDETLNKISADVGQVKLRMLDAARAGDISILEKISDAG